MEEELDVPASYSKRILLEDFFTLYGKNTLIYAILVENHGLVYTKVKARETPTFNRDENNCIDLSSCAQFQHLSWRDIVGCQCMKAQLNSKNGMKNGGTGESQMTDENGENVSPQDNSTDGGTRAYFCVYAYPSVKKRFTRAVKRQRMCLILAVSRQATFQENLKVVEHWRDSVRACLTGGPISALPSRKHYLVFVNPCSGQGKALTIFKQRIAPVLADASVSFEIVVTERQNHAFDYVREAQLSKWHGVVVVAGDGLLFEVFNGLMSRSDWSTAIKIPIGIVPGGSGNGLASTINYASGESISTNQPLLSAFNLAKGRIIPMDLVRVELPKRTLYSFLAIAWGIIADIDIESERLRSIGETRFALWAIPRIANLRVYRGRLSYLPAPGYRSSRPHRPNLLSRSTSSYDHGRKSNSNQGIRNANSVDDVFAVSHEDGDDEISHQNLVRIESQDLIAPEVELDDEEQTAPHPDSLLEPLSRPVPDHWIQTEEDFILVCAAYQTHIGNNVLMAPNAALDDGLMWLMMIRKGASRSQLIQFFMTLDSGSHVDYPWVELVPVRAFRLEPLTENGYITVDGERVEYGPIQAEVLPSIARILTH